MKKNAPSPFDDPPERGVSPTARLAVIAFGLLCLGFHYLGEASWVPVLDSANLALHEAGHPLVGVFSHRLTVYGGTIFQIGFPLAVALHFRKHGHVVGLAVARVWLGESLLNVARYMGDARAQVLPLVGGGDHDWTEILGRWGLLQADTRLAGLLRFCATLFIIAVCVRLVRQRQPLK